MTNPESFVKEWGGKLIKEGRKWQYSLPVSRGSSAILQTTTGSTKEEAIEANDMYKEIKRNENDKSRNTT